MIHWGTTIPCTLYIDGQKKCDFHLPDNVSWEDFRNQVSERFSISIQQWLYTCTNRTFSEQLTSDEEFTNIKTMCHTNQLLLQLNAVTTAPTTHQHSQYNSNFQLAVELSVQSYLERCGPQLLRDMLHKNGLCCNKATCSTSRVPDSNVQDSDTNPTVQLQDSNVAREAVQNIVQASTVEMVDIAAMSSGDIATMSSGDMATMSTGVVATSQQRSRRPSDDDSTENKRPKVLLDKKIYMLACMDYVKKVIPGQKVTATWNLIVKHGNESQWQVVEEGGTLTHLGPVKWEKSTANIYTFSSEFIAPTQEGTFESIWSLHQDTFKRETFTFCKVIVSNTPLRGSSGLATHGNIPTDTSVAKHLNSNKVFCLSKRLSDVEPSVSVSNSEFVVVPPTSSHALTNSTSSESSSIEIIERSNECGYFLHDSDFPGNSPSTFNNDVKVLNAVPLSPSPFQVPPQSAGTSSTTQNMTRSAENVRTSAVISPSDTQSYSMIVDTIHQLNIGSEQQPGSSRLHNNSDPGSSPGPAEERTAGLRTCTSDPDLSQKLALLSDMGFTDVEENRKLLVTKSVEDVALYLSASDKL